MDQFDQFSKHDFGAEFKWGVSTAAYQIEGAHLADGKGPSIWDHFSNVKGKINGNHNGNIACDFYNRYADDLELLKYLNIPNFRFSLSWPRIMPQGVGNINTKGIDFYNRLIDACLEKGIEPWITLYHWDLPLELDKKGGWTNRDILGWFEEYTHLCINEYGDRVKYWMVLNEPMVFVGAGYFLGVHAPGRKGLDNFLAAVHHATLCQALGTQMIRTALPASEVGSTFSCSYLEPAKAAPRHQRATQRIDALLNRLFLEPAIGMGYPFEDLGPLKRIEKYVKQGDDQRVECDFDFIGVQNYTREIVKHSYFVPLLYARIIKAKNRRVNTTDMGWEVYPESSYWMLKKFGSYQRVKKIYITESGAAFPDRLERSQVIDPSRRQYLQDHLGQVLRAQREGVNVQGFFVWTLTDNFEWAEGYDPRFGIIYVDFASQERVIKQSGLWYRDFLLNHESGQN